MTILFNDYNLWILHQFMICTHQSYFEIETEYINEWIKIKTQEERVQIRFLSKMEEQYFSILDYVIFGLMLSISASIGLYYKCTGGKQKTFKVIGST